MQVKMGPRIPDTSTNSLHVLLTPSTPRRCAYSDQSCGGLWDPRVTYHPTQAGVGVVEVRGGFLEEWILQDALESEFQFTETERLPLFWCRGPNPGPWTWLTSTVQLSYVVFQPPMVFLYIRRAFLPKGEAGIPVPSFLYSTETLHAHDRGSAN